MMNGGGTAAIDIVRTDVGDAAAILALQRLAYRQEAQLYHDPDLPPLRETLDELVAAFETHVILKAIVQGELVGSVRAYSCDGICFIGRLMVHPRLQRRGIGTALMGQIEAYFPDVERFQLFTGARSAANIRLYRRLGYTIIATEDVNDRVRLAIMTKPA